MKKHYVVGIDYGTLSSRAVLIDTDTGKQVAESITLYPHGVMDEELPTGEKLPPLWALQNPRDYLDVLETNMRTILQMAELSPNEIAGLGIDFTTCTLVAVDKKGIPLCFSEKYKRIPHAYAKLWKHHAAQPDADKINKLAEIRKEPWLKKYGGKISCEWMFPKILQTLREAPEVYMDTFRFIEAGDWLAWMLTGTESHSAAYAGYKAMWNAKDGYPSNAFFTELDPLLHGIIGSKVSEDISSITETAGALNDYGAKLTGLPIGVPVALSIPDGHAGMLGLNVVHTKKLLMIVGTSSCYFINSEEEKNPPGICGVVKDGIVPGCYTYEAGQSGCGDIFDWFIKNGVPAKYEKEATEKGIGIHSLLREKALRLRPGESGLLAMDWLNGNRSPLADSDLSGCLLGLTLRTKPEEIYRAWLESTAFGAKNILDNFEKNGLEFDSILAGGGIAKKDSFMMQIYADVFGKEIQIAEATQVGALGSAVCAAVAGGIFPTIQAAADVIASRPDRSYQPNREAHKIYQKLYAEYIRLQQIFGIPEDSTMKRLLQISGKSKAKAQTI